MLQHVQSYINDLLITDILQKTGYIDYGVHKAFSWMNEQKQKMQDKTH